MSLTLPIEELSRFRVSATLKAVEDRIALALKPSPNNDLPSNFQNGLLVHFETVMEDGHSTLSIFTSFEKPKPQDITKAVGSLAEPCKSQLARANDALSSSGEDSGAVPNLPPWLTDWADHLTSDSDFSLSANNFASGSLGLGSMDRVSEFSSDSTLPHSAGYFDDRAGTFDFTSDRGLQTQSFDNTIAEPQGSFPRDNDPVASETLHRDLSNPARMNDQPSRIESSMLSSSSTTTPPPSISARHRRRRLACLNPGCSRQFVSEHTRRMHMQTHQPKARRSFPCTMGCSSVFSRQHDRLRHEVAQHRRQCKWSCDQCRRFFSSEKTLHSHTCIGLDGISRWTVPDSGP